MSTNSKAARIWKRTLIGAGMVLGLSLLLWLGSRSVGNHIILWAGVLLSLLCLGELRSMRALPAQMFPYWAWLCVVCVGLWIERSVPNTIRTPLELWSVCAQTAMIVLAFAAWIGVRTAVQDSSAKPARAYLWPVSALLLWGVLPLPWAGLLRAVYGLPALTALVLLSKIGDIVGLYVGSWIGKSHPFPRISPGKTTAGCVASLCAGVVSGGLAQYLGWLPPTQLGWAGGLLVGFLINTSAQAGDLCESWVKRRAGVKDSGRVFGPAGGVLDMVDSLLLSVPTALLTWPVIYGCGG